MPTYPKATKQSFSFKGKNEYYWLIGNEKNPVLLLLPGLSGTHSNLLEFSQKLRQKYFLLLPDLPGWGDSPRLNETLTLTHYAQYFKSLLDHLNINKLNVFGHCMGASLAIEFTHLYPKNVTRLILVSTPYEEGRLGFTLMTHLTELDKHSPHFLHPIFYFWQNRYLNFLTGFIIMQFRTLRRKIKWLLQKLASQTTQNEAAFIETWNDLLRFNYKKIKEIQSPVYLIFGKKDLIISKKQAYKFHSLIPQATLNFIDQAGHVAPVETPDTLASLTIKYLGSK